MSPDLLRTLSLALLFMPSGLSQQGADLATGVRQAKDGDFEEALLTLDVAARKLASEPGRAKDLAQAFLYLGVAYLGLGQESLAKAKFRQALGQDPDLRLSPDEFPAKVLRSFEAARAEMSEAATLEKEAKKKRGKGGLILLGLGGAGAAGIALAVAKERANTPPQATLTITPEGQAISSVTTMRFTARATDAEGDPLSYHWDFGDGGLAFGSVATHVFTREGTFNVRLTVGDGLTSTTASSMVTARTLTGSWRVVGQAFEGVSEFRLSQRGTTFDFETTSISAGGEALTFSTGVLTDPRTVTLQYELQRGNPPEGRGAVLCEFRLDGQADPTLQTITGTHSCTRHACCSCSCGGEQQSITLARQ